MYENPTPDHDPIEAHYYDLAQHERSARRTSGRRNLMLGFTLLVIGLAMIAYSLDHAQRGDGNHVYGIGTGAVGIWRLIVGMTQLS